MDLLYIFGTRVVPSQPGSITAPCYVAIRKNESGEVYEDSQKTSATSRIRSWPRLRQVQLAREPPSQWVLKAKTPIFASRDTVKEVAILGTVGDGTGWQDLRDLSFGNQIYQWKITL